MVRFIFVFHHIVLLYLLDLLLHVLVQVFQNWASTEFSFAFVLIKKVMVEHIEKNTSFGSLPENIRYQRKDL